MKTEIILSVAIGLIIGFLIGLLLFNQQDVNKTSQKYEDFTASAGETWSNTVPFRYTGNSCEDWFISLNIGERVNLNYCYIKDFEVRDDTTPSTIDCRCWLK